MAGGMDALARKLAAQSQLGGMATGPAPANIADVTAEDAGADMGPLPPGAGDPMAEAGMDQEAALGALEAAVESLPPDAASRGREHVQALRELFGGEGASPVEPEGEPPVEEA